MKSMFSTLALSALLLTAIGCGSGEVSDTSNMEDAPPAELSTKMSMLKGADSAPAADKEPEVK